MNGWQGGMTSLGAADTGKCWPNGMTVSDKPMAEDEPGACGVVARGQCHVPTVGAGASDTSEFKGTGFQGTALCTTLASDLLACLAGE